MRKKQKPRSSGVYREYANGVTKFPVIVWGNNPTKEDIEAFTKILEAAGVKL